MNSFGGRCQWPPVRGQGLAPEILRPRSVEVLAKCRWQAEHAGTATRIACGSNYDQVSRVAEDRWPEERTISLLGARAIAAGTKPARRRPRCSTQRTRP